MGCRVLCLTLLALLPGCFGQPCTLITPNVLRLESEETIIIDGHNRAFEADVEIQDFPKRGFNLAKQKVSLNANNKFLGTAKVTIPSKDLANDPKIKQYVYVTVKSPVCNMEKVVLVGYQSGYVFLQADKTIYTPGSTVLYRIFSMDYKMSPVNKAVIIEFLTPENIIVKRDKVKTEESGIISLSHKLPELVSLGVWTISAKYEDSPLQNYTTNFEVKEYVLPTFEIQLIPEQKYFYVSDEEFVVDIKAKFLYGKPVNGMAFVIFGVKKEGIRTGLANTLRRIAIVDGEGVAQLNRPDLKKNFQNDDDMLQYTLYMSVTLITDSGTEIVESELEDIHIVKSPFKILFTKTSKYFKPGMPFDLMVFVTNPDGSPAIRIPVVAEPGNVQGITGAEGTARLTLNTAANINTLPITVKTTHPILIPARQATATMTANAYQSGGNYLHIGITASEVKPGDNLAVNFNIRNTNPAVQNQIQHFTYLIMNKGRILKADRQPRFQGQALVTMSLPITEEFIPSFRIIAYYIIGNEIVSDSVWVDVTDSCMGTLLVTGNTERDNKVQSPGSSMKLKVQADHKAYVGLVAVDKGVYVLNSKFKISQRKVWDSVEKSDIGCTSGSGANSMAVFYDAGLALQSSSQATTQQRSEQQCQVRAARKRRSSAQLIEQKATYASKYKDKVRQCCNDGMQDNPMGHSCERRASNILEGKECVDAFLDCCKYIQKKKKDEKDLKEHDEWGRSDDNDEYIPDADIVSRTEFPESWFWKVEQMTERPNNGISTKTLNVFLKDSITTWEVLAVSLSQNKGICIAKPYEIQVIKDFFIDLKLPYSVVRNEQVEIRAIIYNYGQDKVKVRVELTHNPEFCSLSTAKKKFQQIVEIRPQSSVAVPFILVPLSLGYHDVEVKAAVSGQFVSDGVRKRLKVVPEGVRITKNIVSVTLEPQVKGKDGVQKETVSPLDEKNIVPKTDIETIVTIQGNPISQMVEGSIDGTNLNPLIVVPRGCGEQNMITMTPSVISTIFLDATNQWERIGLNRREEALNNIKQGYVQQLVYRKADSSYAAFKERPASTWLTAYVAKVFAMAQPLVEIQSDVLCGAIKWLILEKQKPDGLFKEDAPVIHQEMVGDIKGSSQDVALTAFVLIAMLESEKTCTPHVNNLKISIDKATNFLMSQFQGLNKPYTIAITSYALAMAGAIDHPEKLLSATTDKLHWNEPGSRFSTIEATSYALLALLRLKIYDLTGPIVRWITEQRYYGAVYGSTQATIVMFQALAQYQIDIPSLNEIDMDVSLSLPERQSPLKYRINLDNALLARSAETRLNKEFVVKAQGKGQGTLTVMTVYHALVTEKEKECKNFDLTVTVKDEEKAFGGPDGALATASVEICAKYLKETDATMSILDVSMMTGFAPDVESLNKLMKGVDKYISKFEINKEATDKGSLIIYLEKISHKQEECIKFNINQIFKVGLIQPASVTVYDYYSPENRCTKFYHVDKDSKLLGTICQKDICRCAEENCFLKQQLEGKIDAAERFDRACAPGVDYVYKATLEEIQKNSNYDNYVMKIIEVIKQGTDENVLDNNRNFVSHIKCRKALDLIQGRDYLIWGVRGDLWDQPSGFSYIIGRDTWIEWWPTERECQNRENKQQCDDFAELSENLEITGCPS